MEKNDPASKHDAVDSALRLNEKKSHFLSVYFCRFTINVVITFFLSPISALLHFQLPARQRLAVVTKPFNHTTVFTARLSDLHLNQPARMRCVCVCACASGVLVLLVYVSVSTKAIKSTLFFLIAASHLLPPTHTVAPPLHWFLLLWATKYFTLPALRRRSNIRQELMESFWGKTFFFFFRRTDSVFSPGKEQEVTDFYHQGETPFLNAFHWLSHQGGHMT